MSRHLMARFRHIHAADGDGLDFDWKPVEAGRLEGYHAKLENGDLIELHGLHTRRKGRPSKWSYHIMGPLDPEVRIIENPGGGISWTKPGVWSSSGRWGEQGLGQGFRQALGSGGQGDVKAREEATGTTNEYTPLRLPTMHHDRLEAMQAAERHYRALNRVGQGRSGIDSGVDYDSHFNRGTDDLDDDYGDIFGGGK